MSESSESLAGKQALRLRRFALATTTYVTGLAILGACTAIGVLDVWRLGVIASAFGVINLAFLVVFRSGANLRFADPSLTAPQLAAGVAMVALILSLGEGLQFLAAPFYGSLFVFAMLRLRPRSLMRMVGFVFVTYAGAFALRQRFYGDRLDLRLEAIHAAVVLCSATWYAFAAGYISHLRGRLSESVQTIEQLANRDALTDTWNRRHIDALLNAELQRQHRMGGGLCVCLADIDLFKSVNDRHGHLVGDEVLKAVAHAMQQTLRSTDALGRFGGEEFLVLLPGTTLADARHFADRLRTSAARVALPELRGAPVTLSIGLAPYVPGDTYDTLLARVDGALYRAKRDGRDRVVEDAAPARRAVEALA